jgi:hypothetical protein
VPRPPANLLAGAAVADRLVQLERGEGRNRRWVEPAQLERLLAHGRKPTGKKR